MNEVPKSPKGPPPDDDDVWTDFPAIKEPADTPFLSGNKLCLTKEGDNGIVTLIKILDHKGVQTYLIDTVNVLRIEVHRYNLAHT